MSLEWLMVIQIVIIIIIIIKSWAHSIISSFWLIHALISCIRSHNIWRRLRYPLSRRSPRLICASDISLAFIWTSVGVIICCEVLWCRCDFLSSPSLCRIWGGRQGTVHAPLRSSDRHSAVVFLALVILPFACLIVWKPFLGYVESQTHSKHNIMDLGQNNEKLDRDFGQIIIQFHADRPIILSMSSLVVLRACALARSRSLFFLRNWRSLLPCSNRRTCSSLVCLVHTCC